MTRNFELDYYELVRACWRAGEDADFDLSVVGDLITLIEKQNGRTWASMCAEADRHKQEEYA